MRYIISIALTSLLALPAWAEVPSVVTDIAPVGALVAQVMGDLGTPKVLLAQGGDPHAFQLRPSQSRDLAEAGAVIWVGPALTPWLDRAMAGSKAVNLQLLTLPGTALRPYADPAGHDPVAATAPEMTEDHAPETDAGQAEEHKGEHPDDNGHDHGHHHGNIDPHAWLDPANGQAWLTDIARTLSDLDPENAATYATNAAAARASLGDLDAALQAQLAPARGVPLVVFHNAYGYFAARYGLSVIGAISDGDAASPGAAHVRRLQTTLQGTPACLFPETNHDPKLMATLAEIPGVRIGAALDPEGASLPGGAALYADLLRALATAIADCAAAPATP